MKAVKGNREYSNISDTQKSYYQNAGFDIYDDDGKQVGWGKGKAVPFEDHMRAVAEIEKLKAEIEALKAKGTSKKAVETKSDKTPAETKPDKMPAETKPDKMPAEKKEGE